MCYRDRVIILIVRFVRWCLKPPAHRLPNLVDVMEFKREGWS